MSSFTHNTAVTDVSGLRPLCICQITVPFPSKSGATGEHQAEMAFSWCAVVWRVGQCTYAWLLPMPADR